MMLAPLPIDQQQTDYSFLFQPLQMKDRSGSRVTTSNVAPPTDLSSGQTPLSVEGCDGPYIDYLDVPLSFISQQLKAPKRKRKGPRGGVVSHACVCVTTYDFSLRGTTLSSTT